MQPPIFKSVAPRRRVAQLPDTSKEPSQCWGAENAVHHGRPAVACESTAANAPSTRSNQQGPPAHQGPKKPLELARTEAPNSTHITTMYSWGPPPPAPPRRPGP